MGENPCQAVHRAVRRGADRVWHDLRFKDLYRNGEEFELTARAMGFAALAILTVIPLLIVVAAANPAPHRGLAAWVIYGMGLTGSCAAAVSLVFSAPGRVVRGAYAQHPTSGAFPAPYSPLPPRKLK
jgi:membrane protein